MNHCLDCGSKVSRGRTNHTDATAVRCLVCIQARVLRSLVYVSPAMKRWQGRKRG